MAKKTVDNSDLKCGDQRLPLDMPHGRNQQFFEDKEDIKWALETHCKRAVEFGFTPENTDGIIMFGNEDAPDAVWATKWTDRKDGIPANHIKALYTLIECIAIPYW
jgi:hypothetical protein